jgi:lipid A 3-O-deacylase
MKTILGKLSGVVMLSAILMVASAHADNQPAQVAVDTKLVPVEKEKDWRLELGTGVLFSNVREDNPDETGYTLLPVTLTAGMKMDDVSLDHFLGGFLRGNTEFLFRADGVPVIHGPESRLLGISAGPRYNFVQPGWKVVPFVEGTVGIIFADSNPIILGTPGSDTAGQHGLGQDFNFMFGVALGARYDITDEWFLRGAIEYMHVSNAGMSEPQLQNRPIDALGPRLSLGYGF